MQGETQLLQVHNEWLKNNCVLYPVRNFECCLVGTDIAKSMEYEWKLYVEQFAAGCFKQ